MPESSSSDNNLDASLTESDAEDDSEDSAKNLEDSDEEEVQKSRADIIKDNVLRKYEDRQGKQLFLRFPHAHPIEDAAFQKQVLALSPLIIKAHRPRQKYARFCLVDFKSKADRDSAFKSIKSAVKTNVALKGVSVNIPRTENDEFLQSLAERKLKSVENKREKSRLRREAKLALRGKNFTSTLVITNLPKSASVVEVRKLFPTAVDIKIKPKKDKMNGLSVAAITLPSTMEARTLVKSKLTLDGTRLIIRFDSQNVDVTKKKKMQKNSKRKLNTTEDEPAVSQQKKSKIAKKIK